MADITTLSVDELISLRSRIDNEIEKQLVQRREEAKRKILELARENFISSDELERLATHNKTYYNPDNPWEVWTGRGRKPGWVKRALDSGKTLTELQMPPR